MRGFPDSRFARAGCVLEGGVGSRPFCKVRKISCETVLGYVELFFAISAYFLLRFEIATLADYVTLE